MSLSEKEHYQLKVLLNYNHVKSHKSKIRDFDACDEFFKLIVLSHIVAAAMELLHITDMEDMQLPPNTFVAEDDWLQDEDVCRDTLYAVSAAIVET